MYVYVCVLYISLLFLVAVHSFVDLDMPSGFPSIFSRAYHTHLSQHSTDFDPLTSSFSSSPTPPSSLLPQFHPLQVRPSDHPQQQVIARSNDNNSTGTSGGGPNSAGLNFENITPSAEAAVQAMQQVLTNINNGAGTGGGGGGNGRGDNSSSAADRGRGKFTTSNIQRLFCFLVS